MKRMRLRLDRAPRGPRTRKVGRLSVESLEGRELLSTATKPFNNPIYAITAALPQVNDPSGSGNVFQGSIYVVGQAVPYSTVWMAQGPRGYFTKFATADYSGQYAFAATVPKGVTELRLFGKDPLNQYSIVTKLNVTRGDPIVAWDSIALRAIRNSNLSTPEAARALAILHLAQYDAVAAVQFPDKDYQVHVVAPKGASAEAAASSAAETVLNSLFPAQAEAFTLAMNQVTFGLPKTQSITDGLALGTKVGQATLDDRANDGSAVQTTLTPSNTPGLWRPTPPGFSPSVDAAWGQVKPFVIADGAQFRPASPPAVGSAAYDQALSEVASLGRLTSSTRTADQTTGAQFWSDGVGTFTSPGHWNEIAEGVSLTQKRTLAQDARLFAMLDTAQADAGIAAYDAKYAYASWRPVSAVQAIDSTWVPLDATPASPSYVSDPAAFAGAASDVLASAFGSKLKFTDNLYASSGGARTFTSFATAAAEAAKSGVWAGTSVSYDAQQGQIVGDKVGSFVVTHFPSSK